MVFINPSFALVVGTVSTLATSASAAALPLSRRSPSPALLEIGKVDGRRDHNVVAVEADLFQTPRSARLPRSKKLRARALQRRSPDNVHIHEHVKGLYPPYGGYYANGVWVAPGYDPDHSIHYNYHHGYTNVDGHGHGYPAPVAVPVPALKKGRYPYVRVPYKRDHIDSDHGKHHHHHHQDRAVEERDDRHHHHHHHHHHDRAVEERDNVHEHDHVHDYEWDHHHHHHHHDRREARKEREDRHPPSHEKNHPAEKAGERKNAESGKEAEGRKPADHKGKKGGGKLRARVYGRDHDDRHRHDHDWDDAHVHEHGHYHRRDLAPAGVPGFVEVASQLFHSSLAKSIAGLVFSADAATNGSSFDLGTSHTHSTQFFLTSVPDSNATDATGAPVNVVRLQIPVLNSQTLESTDFCATFDLAPPSPLSLQRCGPQTGFSQNFAYNSTTGELQPLYNTAAATPVGSTLNNVQVMAALADNTNSAVPSAPSAAPSTPAADPVSDGSATSSVDDSSAADSSSSPQNVSLFFVPASSYYSNAQDVDSLSDSSSASASPSSTASVASTPTGTASSSMVTPVAPSSSAAAPASPTFAGAGAGKDVVPDPSASAASTAPTDDSTYADGSADETDPTDVAAPTTPDSSSSTASSVDAEDGSDPSAPIASASMASLSASSAPSSSAMPVNTLPVSSASATDVASASASSAPVASPSVTASM